MTHNVELKLLVQNRSPKLSRRLRHSLFMLAHPTAMGSRRFQFGRTFAEVVSAQPETRAQRRARVAEERRKANTEKVRLIRRQGRLDNTIVPTSTGSVQRSIERPHPSSLQYLERDEDAAESFKAPRKITGAVRRGLQRATKKKGAANVSVKDV